VCFRVARIFMGTMASGFYPSQTHFPFIVRLEMSHALLLCWALVEAFTHLVTFGVRLILFFSCMTFIQNVGVLRLDKLGLQGN